MLERPAGDVETATAVGSGAGRRLGRGGRAHRSGAEVAATGAATAGGSVAAAAEARTSRTGAEALTSGASGSEYSRTFWPALSTCTPAVTTRSPGASPAMTIASLPSAPPTWTGRATAVIDPGSTTQTELPPWCSFSADSG